MSAGDPVDGVLASVGDNSKLGGGREGEKRRSLL